MASHRNSRSKGLPLLLLATMMATALVNCRPNASRRDWNKKWGPLVPHKSFPGDCGICHVSDRWDVLRDDFSFDHEKQTGYPLEGVHAQAACLRCHNDRGPVQVYVTRGCAGCHPDPHTATLGLDCERCHNENNWQPGDLIAEHARTRFPLFGSHVATPCENCHAGATVGQFRGAPLECELCHQTDLARATVPDHTGNGWTTGCDRCHTPVAWEQASLVHDFFPLVGGHAGLDCTQCHTSGALGVIPSDCYSCHAADYTSAPDHASQSFSHTCDQCHSTTAWTPATFDHSVFALTGGHAGLTCIQCHTSGTFGTIPSDCYSCHSTDYAGAPDHVSQNFPHTCEQCHSSAAWTPAALDHSAFALTGGHAGVACTQCHTSGTFGTIPSDCYSCHAADYAGAPDHASQNYPHTCESCHTSVAWTPSTFDHSAFALTGGHAGLTCLQCHTSGTYGVIPSDCYSCHSSDYAGAANHASLSFAQTCQQCHTTTAWIPSTFVHGFSLTGEHNVSCERCHTTGDASVYTCTECHPGGVPND